jgi:hypothetical protein
MANHPVVQRTAPIAIAPKPPRPEPTASRTDSFQRLELGNSLHARSSAAGSVSRSASASLNGASVPPCYACRHAGTRCTMSSSDDDEGCIPCQVNGCECSLVTSTSPQSRKRKLNGEQADDSIGKRSVPPSRLALPWYAMAVPRVPWLNVLHSPGSCLLSWRERIRIPTPCAVT